MLGHLVTLLGRGISWLIDWVDNHNGFVTALATLAIAALTWRLWVTSNQQWHTMQQQLELSDRPWIKLLDIERPNITFTGPSYRLKLGKVDEVFLGVVPKIQNVGHSTAIHIRMDIQLVIHRWANGWGDFSREQKASCETISNRRDAATDIVLFPDDPFDGMSHSSGEFLKPSNLSEVNGTKYIAPAMVGCIDYQFQTSPTHHQTSFVYEIVRADSGSRIFLLGEDMSPAQIRLIRDALYDAAN